MELNEGLCLGAEDLERKREVDEGEAETWESTGGVTTTDLGLGRV